MSFREVQVHEVREVLRLWVRGEGLRSIERLAVVDRKTVRRYVEAAEAGGAGRGRGGGARKPARRYVEAAEAGGLVRDDGEEQLCDELLAHVVEQVRPHRTDG